MNVQISRQRTSKVDDPPDEALIEKSLAGDSTAYDMLVRRHAGRLLTMIRHRTKGAEDAEDLMQEALAQAYFKLDTYAGKSAFFTWLYRIAFNLSITKSRKRRLESTHQRTAMEAAPVPVEPAADAEQRLSDAEQAERIREAIDRLEEDRRTVLVLRDMEGLDYGEIAEMLEIPKGTVRSRLHRARSDLREMLASEDLASDS